MLLSLERDEDHKCNVDAMLVAFSMAVKGGVDDRLRCLFNLAANAPAASPVVAVDADADPEAQPEPVEDAREVSQPELERLLQFLLETYQIPSEKRVVAVEDVKFPFQEYKAAEPHDLLEAAVQAQVDAKKITAEEANARSAYTFDAFAQIMRSKPVCLWGECFANGKKRMKN